MLQGVGGIGMATRISISAKAFSLPKHGTETSFDLICQVWWASLACLGLTADKAVSLQLLSQLCPQVVHPNALVPESFAIICLLLQQGSAGIHGLSTAPSSHCSMASPFCSIPLQTCCCPSELITEHLTKRWKFGKDVHTLQML